MQVGVLRFCGLFDVVFAVLCFPELVLPGLFIECCVVLLLFELLYNELENSVQRKKRR